MIERYNRPGSVQRRLLATLGATECRVLDGPERDEVWRGFGELGRVGMEDVLTLAKGVPVEHNEQLVSRAVELGRLAANLNQLQRAINRGHTEGVPVALVEELRRLLHDVRQALVGKAGAA